MGNVFDLLDGLKPALLMVLVQVMYAGVTVLYTFATNDGMSVEIIVAYRFMLASAVMVPLALVLERKRRPKLTWRILFQAFLCRLFGGSLNQNLYIKSLELSSATFSSAINNLMPAITFVLSISFRLERLNLRNRAGKAKVLGTLVGITGAMILTLYKGLEIKISPVHVNLLHQHEAHVGSSHSSSTQQHVLALILALTSCVAYSLWLIIQGKMSMEYPRQYSSTALMCLMATVQSTVYALFTNKDMSRWKLGWNVRLLTVVYGGTVVSGLTITLISWCVKLRGPFYVSIFSPLMLVVVAIVTTFLLGEKLHIGCVIGTVLIVCGLYVVLWGKSKEMEMEIEEVESKSKESQSTVDDRI